MPVDVVPDWDQVRGEMPVTERWAYFDHAAVAPLPRPTMEAMSAWVRSAGSDGVADWSRWRKTVERARLNAARLLSAAVDEIALVRSTTEGITIVAEGFPWQPGDNVVTLENEFPSNLYPWLNQQHHGVEVRRVPVPDGRVNLADIDAACDQNTKIVSVSWVGFSSGWRVNVADVAEIAHRRGALLFLDAIQGLGVFPLDVEAAGVDFVAADGHKWLLGPEGAGLLYIQGKLLERLRPIGIGWNSVVHAGDYTNSELRLKDSAARYEGGTYNMAGFIGMAASLEWLLELGIERVSERVLACTSKIRDMLRDEGAKLISHPDEAARSGIISFDVPGIPAEKAKRTCFDGGVIVNQRAGHVRVSAHCYHDDKDIERLRAACFGD